MRKDKVCVAQFGAPHGVKGEVRLTSYLAEAEAVFTYSPLTNEEEKSFTLLPRGMAGNQLRVAVVGITDRDAAAKLTGTRLYVDRAALPALASGEFYHDDFPGLVVLDPSGDRVGDVVAVHDFGAGDILEIRFIGMRETQMVLYHPETITAVDLKAGTLTYVAPEELVVEKEEDHAER